MSVRPTDSLMVPRFAGIGTFLRLPYVEDPTGLDIAVLGVPFDGGLTSTISGARFAPRAVRDASSAVKPYSQLYGINPYEKYNVADCGDAAVNPLDLELSREGIAQSVARLVRAGAVPICVGGDHSVSLPILRGVGEKYKPVSLMLFDAHSDTSDTYFGVRYGAGTPFRRAIEEGLIDPKKTLQVGLHGTTYTVQEHEYALSQGIQIITSEDILEYGIKWVVQHYNKLGDGPIYVSIDMDVLDPAYAPASLPSPGGISSRELIYLLHKLAGRRIVGADVVEVQSPYDSRSKMTCCLAAQLIFDLICLTAMGKGE